MKNCDQVLENAAHGYTIQTDPKAVKNKIFFLLSLKSLSDC